MYQYYKQSHKTHVLLLEIEKTMIEDYETLNLFHLNKIQEQIKKHRLNATKINIKPEHGIAVDAWCTNHLPTPGPGGYRGMDLQTGEQLFLQNHLGPCTNNVAEFLAIVHGLMYCRKHKAHNCIYSDSEIAMAWIKMKQTNSGTDLSCNPKLVEKVWHAERWLFDQKHLVPVLKWETKNWGEIPADFNRK